MFIDQLYKREERDLDQSDEGDMNIDEVRVFGESIYIYIPLDLWIRS